MHSDVEFFTHYYKCMAFGLVFHINCSYISVQNYLFLTALRYASLFDAILFYIECLHFSLKNFYLKDKSPLPIKLLNNCTCLNIDEFNNNDNIYKLKHVNHAYEKYTFTSFMYDLYTNTCTYTHL